MKLARLIQDYEFLADKADAAFRKMQAQHGSCIRCEPFCSDCCHAVFGLFLIEAAYLKQHFDQLEGEQIRAALLRCNDAERALRRMEISLQKHSDDPQSQALMMARTRIRCPLLSERQECILYPQRPITCRVYGIPTKIQGKARVCGKAEFKPGESYPAFDLDGIYQELYKLSKELLDGVEKGNSDKASFLISVPRALTASFNELIQESFAG
jgi:Fe-S-cluster containining protein